MSTTEKPTSTNYQELTIIAKMETLTNQVYPRLRRWPRHERYALSQEVRNGLTDFMSVMHMANKVVSKRTQYAQEADGILSGLKVKFRLAYSQKYISEGFHDIISIELSEIGKLLVNYIKTSSRVRNKKYSKEEYSEENKNDNNESE
jgi:hypothetical protein